MIKKILLIIGLSSFLFSSVEIIKDNANIVKDEKIMKQYKKYNLQLLKDFDIDFRVLTTNTDVDVNRLSNYAFKKLFKENRSKSGKNLLMIIFLKQKKLRLEVSSALEPVYTDAFVSYLERVGIIPYFRENKVEEAIYSFTELIRDRAVEASKNKEFIPPMETKSIGAGAKTELNLGIKNKLDKAGEKISGEFKSPKEILNFYVENVLKKHNKNPDLDIYTDATKDFWKKWVVTTINQNHEIENLKHCVGAKTYYSFDNKYAVLRKDAAKDRLCSPYFFKKENGSWKLDFATMSKTILFNHEMEWYFNKKERLKNEGKFYAFAFDEYYIGIHGFPHTAEDKYKKPSDVRWGFQGGYWYRAGTTRKQLKENPDKYFKVRITNIYQASPAHIRLDMQVNDFINDIEVNGVFYKDVSYNKFFDLMGEAKTGSIVKLYVYHHKKNYVREGVAP